MASSVCSVCSSAIRKSTAIADHPGRGLNLGMDFVPEIGIYSSVGQSTNRSMPIYCSGTTKSTASCWKRESRAGSMASFTAAYELLPMARLPFRFMSFYSMFGFKEQAIKSAFGDARGRGS